jgi:HK97 family phage major capsid protein
MDITELKNKRAGLVVQMRSLLDSAAKAGRDLNADEQTTYANLEKDVDGIGARVTREESLATVENNLRGQRDGEYRPAVAASSSKNAPRVQSSDKYREAFCNYMLGGRGDFQNVLSTGVDTDGGYLLPEEFDSNIQKLLYSLDPMRQLATVKTSTTLVNIPVQYSGATFAVIPEGGTYPRTDPKLGRVVMRAVKMGGFILASDELNNDSDVASFISDAGSQALVNLQSQLWLTGDDATQPQGIFNATSAGGIAVQGVTGAVSATAAITGDNLIDIFHKLKSVYRNRASWLMHDDTMKLIRKLKNSVSGDYLWQPGLQAGAPDRLLGRPIYTSEYAPVAAVSAKSIVFGDLKAYQIRDRLNTQIKRFDELFGESGQIGWRFTHRGDGRFVDGNGIVTFTHGAAS